MGVPRLGDHFSCTLLKNPLEDAHGGPPWATPLVEHPLEYQSFKGPPLVESHLGTNIYYPLAEPLILDHLGQTILWNPPCNTTRLEEHPRWIPIWGYPCRTPLLDP